MMAFFRVIALLLALAGSSAWSSHPSESARNQYEAREDRPQPQLLTEATDHRLEVHMSQRDNSINNSTNGTKVTASDLQVGCGDGFIKEKLQNSETDKNKVRRKRVPWGSRRKRSYTPWSEQSYNEPSYQSIRVWRAPTYQLSRPYYVPIYGTPGRIPIFYPPQSLGFNPGVPKDNPVKKPYQGSTYLPPVEGTTMTVDNRFREDEEMWNWGDGNQQITQRPPQRPQQPTQRPSGSAPTRATLPPGVPKTPPLIHRPTDPEGFNTVEEVPAPPAATSRPVTTARPEPSRCVWAIISCCSTTEISYNCFEQRGCVGAFWDTNPCDSQFAKAAIEAALNYYNTK